MLLTIGTLLGTHAAHADSTAAAKRFTPWQFGAKLGDCTSDNSAALKAAAVAAVASNGVLWTGDSCIGFGGQTWNPPAHLVWRSDFTEPHRMFWVGAQNVSPIEATGSIDVDGIILDLKRPANAIRSGSSVTMATIGFGIHGSMATDNLAYLDGVKIGRVKVENGAANTAIALVNVKNLVADQLTVEHNWGQGVSLVGLTHGQINTITTLNIGNLGTQANRAGQSVAIFTEADPRKKPAAWYTIAWQSSATLANSQPCRNVLPTDDLQIGTINTWGNTDTDVYVHDYGPDDNGGFAKGGRPATCNGGSAPLGWGTGVGNIHIGSIAASVEGKDELKVRRWAHDVHVAALHGHNLGGRAFACEVWCSNFYIDQVDVDAQSPYDIVAALKNDKLGSDFYSNDQNPASAVYNGTNQTLNTVAVGGYISQAQHVVINGGSIKNIGGLAYDPTSEGYCLQVDASTDITIKMTCINSAGNALRMSDTQQFALNIDSQNACQNQAGKTCYALYVTNDGDGDSHNGSLSWQVSDSTSPHVVTAPVRINGAASNINLIAGGSIQDASRSRLSVVIDPKASNIRSN